MAKIVQAAILKWNNILIMEFYFSNVNLSKISLKNSFRKMFVCLFFYFWSGDRFCEMEINILAAILKRLMFLFFPLPICGWL